MKVMLNKIFSWFEWFENNISKPIQYCIYALLVGGLLSSLFFGFKGCNTDYENMQVNFINEEVALHGEMYKIEVLHAEMQNSIYIKENENSDILTAKHGNFVSVTVCVTKCIDGEDNHILDNNDFKLKDHTGTKIPMSQILDMIEITGFDVIVDKDDTLISNSSFTTTKAIEDYTWIGRTILPNQRNIFTINFEVDSDLNVKETIMIFEADFFIGSGKKTAATDIVLFERKNPIK